MRKSNKEIAEEILYFSGGAHNIVRNTMCMTRLHIQYKDHTLLDLDAIKAISGVLAVVDGETIQIVFGPGKVSNVGNAFAALTRLPLEAEMNAMDVYQIAKESKTIQQTKHNKSIQRFFKHFANIFLPILPGIAGAGLINGITKAINVSTQDQLVGEWWYALIMTIGWALFLYLPIFVGMNAAKEYKGTAILGGIGGALSIAHNEMPLLLQVTDGNIILPLTNDIYNPVAGGILAAVFTGIGFAFLERGLRKLFPEVIGSLLTPLFTLLIGGFLVLLVFQPLGSFITDMLFVVIDFIFNKMGLVGGFILASLQLPLVSMGLHRVFTPIHTILNDVNGPTQGVNYLLPILMVAGGGQVGSAFALYVRTKNTKLKKALVTSIPAGILGVGEPLMYAVTLPLFTPFVMACIGSGIGGMIIVMLKVGAISQDVSGILASAVMYPGTQLSYLIGLSVAYGSGFILTYCFGFSEERINTIF